MDLFDKGVINIHSKKYSASNLQQTFSKIYKQTKNVLVFLVNNTRYSFKLKMSKIKIYTLRKLEGMIM